MKLTECGAVLVLCGLAAVAAPLPLAAQPRPRPAVRPPTPPRATPQPAFVLDSATVKQRSADFKTVIRGLVFDTSITGCDRRVLMRSRIAGSQSYVGPKAELAPEIGAALLTGTWAAYGRIVARITLWSDTAYVPSGFSFRLAPGVSYLAVRMVPGRPDSLMGFLIAVAPDTSVRAIQPVRLRVLMQTGPARFILLPNDDGICVPCNSKMCCPT